MIVCIVVLVLVGLALFFGRKLHKAEYRRLQKAAVVVGIVALVGAAFGWMQLQRQSQTSKANEPKKTNQNNQNSSSGTKKSGPLDYQVVFVNTSHSPVYVQVFTKETSDDRLIALNDLLYAKYKGSYNNLLIGYFDERQVALTYFDTMNKVTTKQEDKRQLTTHYIATMVYINAPGQKQKVATLTRLIGVPKVIKQY